VPIEAPVQLLGTPLQLGMHRFQHILARALREVLK
jgi:hypothetical protein